MNENESGTEIADEIENSSPFKELRFLVDAHPLPALLATLAVICFVEAETLAEEYKDKAKLFRGLKPHSS